MPDIKVLLVDDEADYVEPLGKRLARRGVTVEKALCGESALEKLASFPADVVVLDVMMPNMDGMAALHRIKTAYPHVEVVMLTGHASMEASSRGMELGAFDYMMKPVKFEELFNKIEDAARCKAHMEESGGQRSRKV